MRPYQPTTNALTVQERRRRVAELLCKAIVLAEAKRVLQPVRMANGAGDLAHKSALPDDTDADEGRILDYLALAGEGSPRSIRSALGLSRSATYHALRRLTVAGHVVRSGQTRMLAYRLSQVEFPPQNHGREKTLSPQSLAPTVRLASGNDGRMKMAV